MVLWLMHINQLDTPYKSYRLKFDYGVIWGHWGQKVIFTKNAISPTDYMVWSCVMHIYQLDTPYKSYRLKFIFGVIWGHKVSFTKML